MLQVSLNERNGTRHNLFGLLLLLFSTESMANCLEQAEVGCCQNLPRSLFGSTIAIPAINLEAKSADLLCQG
jgi:hypothetical protein